MIVRPLVIAGLAGALCLAINPRLQAEHEGHDAPVGLIKAVREATNRSCARRSAKRALSGDRRSPGDAAWAGSCRAGPVTRGPSTLCS